MKIQNQDYFMLLKMLFYSELLKLKCKVQIIRMHITILDQNYVNAIFLKFTLQIKLELMKYIYKRKTIYKTGI